MGAFGIVKSTYDLLTTANTVSDKINDLIKKNELGKKDRLNFKALPRAAFAFTARAPRVFSYRQTGVPFLGNRRIRQRGPASCKTLGRHIVRNLQGCSVCRV